MPEKNNETYAQIDGSIGKINISAEVISAIANSVMEEIDELPGYVKGNEFLEIIGKKTASKTAKATISDNSVILDLNVYIKYGNNISAVCQKIQNSVSSAVEAMISIAPVVNVNVIGIAFPG